MAPGGGSQVLILVFAVFVLPQVASMIPSFDPLMMIIAVFGVLAGVQHLSMPSDDAGEQDARDGNRRAKQGPLGAVGGATRDKGRQQHPTTLILNAEKALEQNNYERAEELANKVLELDPELSRAWELLAQAQKWAGKRERAAETVEKALDLYEVKSKILTDLAEELRHEECPADVAEECLAKGQDFLDRQQFDLALECFSRAIKALDGGGGFSAVAEEHREVYLRVASRRAQCAQQVQEWGIVRKDAAALLTVNPDCQKALLQRAAANEALENFPAALADARRLLALDPKSVTANRLVHSCQRAMRA